MAGKMKDRGSIFVVAVCWFISGWVAHDTLVATQKEIAKHQVVVNQIPAPPLPDLNVTPEQMASGKPLRFELQNGEWVATEVGSK